MSKKFKMSYDDFKKIFPVGLAGGSGERLWPISRVFYPKPFVDFDTQGSMFQKTVARIQDMELLDLEVEPMELLSGVILKWTSLLTE